jgi:hypothetical protein
MVRQKASALGTSEPGLGDVNPMPRIQRHLIATVAIDEKRIK